MQPVFINKDAEFLDQLGQTFIDDGDLETGMRLRTAAQHLQSMDDKLAFWQANGEYAAGMREAYNRVYGRSNLPPEERAMPKEAAKFGIGKITYDESKVKKIPRGMTAEKLKAQNEAKKLDNAASQLTGIKLNLGALRLEPKE